MNLIHYADVQVKVRLKDLSQNFIHSLTSIEKIIAKSEAEIVVLAGDIFEFDEPNDIEREIIYNHFINIMNINTVKEFVLINGNHDFNKDNFDNKNPTSIFKDVGHLFLKNTSISIMSKLNYLQFSNPTPSIAYPNDVVWLPYSHEDGGIYNKSLYSDIDFDENKMYISIFHDIVLDYVNENALPVKNKKRLFSIIDFHTKTILAGDIHESWNHKGFFYPGSTIQRNHGEGSYLTFYGKNKVKYKSATSKMVNWYSFDINKKIMFEKDKMVINNNLEYITIDLSNVNSKCDANFIIDQCVVPLKAKFDNNTLIIKIKISTDYQLIREELVKALVPFSQFDIEIQDIKTIDEHLLNEFTDLNNGEVKNSITKEIVIELFENGLGKLNDNTEMFNNVKFDVLEMFKSNLDLIFDADRSFKIDLKSLKTNGFQMLGKNQIDCDFYGLSRIVGTNGYGKTTIYNMFYFLRYGIVYPNLKIGQKKYNNLLIFNNKMPNIDDVLVEGIFNINGKKVVIERKVNRKWKTGTNELQKLVKDKINFISTTKQSLTIKIYDNDGNIKSTLIDSNAETALNNWFGGVINNLAIINYDKLKSLLNLPSNKLENLLLDYIGNDFIKSMIESFPIQKQKILENTAKPELNDVQLENKLIEIKTDHKIKNKNLDDNQILSNKLDANLKKSREKLKTKNAELIELGNIPKIINDKNLKVSDYQKIIDNYKIESTKPLIEKPNLTKPTFKFENVNIDELKENINKLKKANEINQEKIQDFVNLELIKIDALERDERNKVLKYIEEHKQKIKTRNVELLESIKNSKYFMFINDYFDETENKYSKDFEMQTKIDNGINNLNAKIKEAEDSIKNGICSECGTKLVELDENHVNEKIKTLKLNIQKLNEAKNNLNVDALFSLKEKLNTTLNELTLDLNFVQKLFNDGVINDGQLLSFNLCNDKTKTIEINENILKEFTSETYENQILNLSNKDEIKLKFELFEKIKTDFDLLINSNVITDLISEKCNNIKDKIKLKTDINSALNAFQLKIENYNSEKINYNNLLETYNEEINNYNTEITKINDFNKKIVEDKINYDNAIKSKSELTAEIFNIETNELVKYNNIVESINQTQKLIDETDEELKNKNSEISKQSIELNKMLNDIEKYAKDLELFHLFNQKKYIIKYYDIMIRQVLPKSVFNYYRDSVNYKFGELLKDVDFGLEWSNDGNLYKIEYNGNKKIYTNIMGASGMETIFLGLSFVYSVVELNHKHKFSHIFIDELSGQLNKGKTNDVDMSTNYQEMLLMLLNKFENSKIFIVDHVIKNMFETKTLKLVRPENQTFIKIE